jgi:hypothetical protein
MCFVKSQDGWRAITLKPWDDDAIPRMTLNGQGFSTVRYVA